MGANEESSCHCASCGARGTSAFSSWVRVLYWLNPVTWTLEVGLGIATPAERLRCRSCGPAMWVCCPACGESIWYYVWGRVLLFNWACWCPVCAERVAISRSLLADLILSVMTPIVRRYGAGIKTRHEAWAKRRVHASFARLYSGEHWTQKFLHGLWKPNRLRAKSTWDVDLTLPLPETECTLADCWRAVLLILIADSYQHVNMRSLHGLFRWFDAAGRRQTPLSKLDMPCELGRRFVGYLRTMIGGIDASRDRFVRGAIRCRSGDQVWTLLVEVDGFITVDLQLR